MNPSPETALYAPFDRRDPTPVSDVIVETVAVMLNREPTHLTPLSRTLAPEAIDALYRRGPKRSPRMVTFEYEGCEVEVTPGEVVVHPPSHVTTT